MATVAANIACHTCAASLISKELQLPIGATKTQLRSQYSSFTSSCSISTMSLTSVATTAWVTL